MIREKLVSIDDRDRFRIYYAFTGFNSVIIMFYQDLV